MVGALARSLSRRATAMLAFAVAWPFYMGIARQDEDAAVRATLDKALRQGKAQALAEAALANGEVDDAAAYGDLAARLGHALPAALQAQIAAARAVEDEPATRLRRCATGALTGAITDGASAVCTVAADLTVLGDLRDIVVQGAAWAAGRDYDRLVLGLSAVGLGATALTAVSAGAAMPAKAGLSLVKGARRAGQVPPALTRAVATEIRLVAQGGDAARLARATGAVDTVRREHGALEAARMLRHAGSLDELGDAASMYGRYGRMARPVMALSGKTSIRAFKAGYKVVPTMLPAAAMLVGSAVLLLAGLALRGAIERRTPRRVEPTF